MAFAAELAAPGAGVATGQQPPTAQEAPTFQAGVSLVKVDVQVIDGGRLVPDLTVGDFVILDEGEPQSIVHFGRDAEPLWVLLLLDVSGSMRKRLEEMAAASRRALQSLMPGDHVGVMLFSRRTATRQVFTAEPAVVANEIGNAAGERGLGSGTRINASIIEAAHHVRRQLEGKQGRRAILILTDNSGVNYQMPDEKVLKALYDADTVLNAIVTGKARPPARPRQDRYVNPDFTPSDVFRLARETGGEVVRANKAGQAFETMMESMRTRYGLHYHAPEGAPRSFREIKVELTAAARKRHRRAVVRARSGYYHEAADQRE